MDVADVCPCRESDVVPKGHFLSEAFRPSEESARGERSAYSSSKALRSHLPLSSLGLKASLRKWFSCKICHDTSPNIEYSCELLGHTHTKRRASWEGGQLTGPRHFERTRPEEDQQFQH